MSTTTFTLPGVSFRKRYQISLHVLVWLIIAAFLFYIQAGRGLTFLKGIHMLVGLSFNLLIFYFNWFVLIPKFLAKNQIMLYTASVLAMLGIVALVRTPLDVYLFDGLSSRSQTLSIYEQMLQYVIGGLSNVFISSAIKVTGNYIRNERLNKELENQKLMAELAYLKSQVNPHFLFNTLNNIYSLAYKQSPETPDAIMKLSLLMRYMLYESNDTHVMLQKEVEHIHNFIDLQKLRLREQAIIQLNVEGSLEGKQIAPMMLMTLVENAFKHGLVSKNEVGIIIKLEVTEKTLVFSTINNISTHKKREYGGIGLENLKQRLNLLYQNRHQLSFEEKEGTFYASLKLYF